MSNLQIGLAIAGGLILAGIVAHSTWSARRNQPKRATQETPLDAEAAKAAEGSRTDLLAERQEPRFEGDSFGDADLASLSTMMAIEKKPGLDALIDVIAPVMVDALVSGEAALAAMPATRRAGSKPFGVEGLNAANHEWELPAAGQRYTAFQCGVQLANRVGPLSQIEYSEFVMKAQDFADAMGGEPEFPEMLDEVARARELDQFASAHDAQLSFTLRAINTAWSPGYVQQSAARLGFVAGGIPGRMVLPASIAGSAPLLGLAFDAQAAMAEDPEQTALREITLSLDVPQVARSEQPFARMCESALSLARSMDGAITDDNGKLIRAEAMDLIASELEQLYGTLDERDLSAGSVLARRLFS